MLNTVDYPDGSQLVDLLRQLDTEAIDKVASHAVQRFKSEYLLQMSLSLDRVEAAYVSRGLLSAQQDHMDTSPRIVAIKIIFLAHIAAKRMEVAGKPWNITKEIELQHNLLDKLPRM